MAVVLNNLADDFPLPIVIIQHVDAQFAEAMATWLDKQCRLTVRTAREADHLEVGTALVAETNDHLIMHTAHELGYTSTPADSSYHPSIDVFFESVARYRKGRDIGVLLTGMGKDGAKGLRVLRDSGSYTIAQDKESSVVYGMPKQAAALEAATEILPLVEIAPRLIELCRSKTIKT